MRVKICGVRSRGDVIAAARSGAHYVGLVFYPPSPRCLSLPDAGWLADVIAEEEIRTVALTVDASDEEFEHILEELPVDMLQLHGAETVERVAEIRKRFGVPVMKAVSIADESDLPALDAYAQVADQLLLDARPPRDAVLPGGNGLSFDWRLISGRSWGVPWMLAGGLTAENVAEAIRLTGAGQVDVSSGVESAPGIKDQDLITAFVHAAMNPDA
jgi:phosphoribosylanthranilate isomerase